MKKKIFILMLLFVLFGLNVLAGDIYTYKDKNGNTVISNTPVPDQYKASAKKIDAYDDQSGQRSQSQTETEEKKKSDSKARHCDYAFGYCKGHCSPYAGIQKINCVSHCKNQYDWCMRPPSGKRKIR